MSTYIKNFNEITSSDTPTVGGKNASLGEMIHYLPKEGIRVPGGFATTAEAYWFFLEENNLKEKLTAALEELDHDSYANLEEVGDRCRTLMREATMPKALAEAIRKAYRDLKEREEGMTSVAVRSSATAEDLPQASFAGQHESFLNISGEDEVVRYVQRCIASLFTDRAIKYREDNGFDHMKIALSAGVQRMVRADKASAGVAFTIAPDSGFREVVFINGAWGLGENVVQGTVNADEYYVFKPALKKGNYAILSKKPGSKEKTMVFASSKGETTTVNTDTPEEKMYRLVLSDEEIHRLAKWCVVIEEHYGRPMDIEWAKDGLSGSLFIVQARPETVYSRQDREQLIRYELKEKGKVIVKGIGIGDKIAAGKARILHAPEEGDKLKKGEVLVTDRTNPDWDPIMEKAAAIVTNSGGRTSHAAIVAREQGVVAAIGAEGATEKIKDGQVVTVSTLEGTSGIVYEGKLKWEEKPMNLKDLKKPETDVMLILADPAQAFQFQGYPIDGVGLMRLEFIINNSIKAHPMALVHFEELEDKAAKKEIERLTVNYDNKETYFVDELAMAVGMIAAAFYPRDVIVRMSDFKTNEYADLLGGEAFEPKEENPMLGFRGASRYYSDQYREGFRLECEAMKKVRRDMGLDNVILMVPFCRTPEEGKKVLKQMEEYGLKRGEDGLRVYVMVEIPSNVILADAFADIFDGFSIGSNDLTQLTLGVDRDSEIVSSLFDERNEAVKRMLAMVIEKAREKRCKVGLCGQAPSDFPEMAQFLVEQGIDSISFNPDALLTGMDNMVEAEEHMIGYSEYK
jgi:pyruvate,water dikinase